MNKIQVIDSILKNKIVAVIRAESKEEAIKTVEAVKKGGINIIEITMTVPGAIDIIKVLCEKYKDEVIIGAGTVLDSETARCAILAGAKFVVSPMVDKNVIMLCNKYAIPVMPGAVTPKEVIEALECGVDIIKVFPAIIKSLKGPFPQANFMPTGGVNASNVAEWIKAGAVAIGSGSDLTKGASRGDYELVTKTARELVDALHMGVSEVK